MNAPRALVLAALILSTGCPIAPSEVEATITLGPKDVKYRATLKDMKVLNSGLSSALPVVSELSEPPAEMLAEMGWLGRPSTYRWRPTDGGVDLDLEGTFPRAEWDRCAQASCDGGHRCDSFPFERCGGAFRLADSQLVRLGNTPESWALDAGVIAFRAGNLEEVARSGVSAAPAWAVFSAQPAAAKAAGTWLHAYSEAHENGALPEVKKLLAQPALGGADLERVVADGVRTARQRLLWAVLVDSEANADLPDPPGAAVPVHQPLPGAQAQEALQPGGLPAAGGLRRGAPGVGQDGWAGRKPRAGHGRLQGQERGREGLRTAASQTLRDRYTAVLHAFEIPGGLRPRCVHR